MDDCLARVLRRLVALRWILLEHAVEHHGEGLGYVVPDLPDRNRLYGRLLHENLLRRLAVKRGSAGEHLVQHDTEAVDVRPVVGPLAGRLLRAHVLRRADHHPLGGQLRRGRIVGRLGDPEVGHEHVSGGIEQDVVGLDIAVDDALAMGVREGVRNLPRNARRVADGQALVALQELAQRRAVHAPHRDVEDLVPVPANLVDLHDVRVLEPRDSARLAHEALRQRRGGREAEVENLDREVAGQRLVPHAEHRREAPLAQQGANRKFLPECLLQATTQRGEIGGHGGRQT